MERGKRAQFEISFSMIFSIILMIAFVVVAFYAISYFLKFKSCADTGLFKESLQNNINNVWNSDSNTYTFSDSLPTSIQYLCFADMKKSSSGIYKEYFVEFQKLGLLTSNMFFYPTKKACSGSSAFKIEHINISHITSSNNPYCIKNSGKIELILEKGYYETSVKIK